jgi:uncharacterized protein YdhG (YjbR/CyaY superfamily)
MNRKDSERISIGGKELKDKIPKLKSSFLRHDTTLYQSSVGKEQSGLSPHEHFIQNLSEAIKRQRKF